VPPRAWKGADVSLRAACHQAFRRARRLPRSRGLQRADPNVQVAVREHSFVWARVCGGVPRGRVSAVRGARRAAVPVRGEHEEHAVRGRDERGRGAGGALREGVQGAAGVRKASVSARVLSARECCGAAAEGEGEEARRGGGGGGDWGGEGRAA
jgi:hypothetical protein